MSTQELDSKKRIVLPEGQPGELFEIQPQGEGRFLLVRVGQPPVRRKLTREECREAIRNSPLTFDMTWEELREITREP